MKPIEFAEQNVVFAKDQPEYIPLPAHVSADGVEVTSCWGMSLRERIRAAVTGRVYLTLLTFGSPLQTQIVSVNPPTEGATP